MGKPCGPPLGPAAPGGRRGGVRGAGGACPACCEHRAELGELRTCGAAWPWTLTDNITPWTIDGHGAELRPASATCVCALCCVSSSTPPRHPTFQDGPAPASSSTRRSTAPGQAGVPSNMRQPTSSLSAIRDRVGRCPLVRPPCVCPNSCTSTTLRSSTKYSTCTSTSLTLGRWSEISEIRE